MRRFLPALLVLGLGAVDCYSQGDGTPPPRDSFYFPVGLATSANGTVLYAVNSDFDLQYNGGTIQSYDLRKIREAAYDLVDVPANVPPGCPYTPPGYRADGSGTRYPLGETCAPPVDSRTFFRRGVVIGAFATSLLISRPPERLVPSSPASGAPACTPDPQGTGAFTCPGGGTCVGSVGQHAGTCENVGTRALDRLFVPVRGNASITWVDVQRDAPDAIAPPDWPATPYGPFELACAQGPDFRCSGSHEAGTNPNDNSRGFVMPGEPFGATLSEDGESFLVTHQSDTKTSLFRTGLSRSDTGPGGPPTIDFVLDGLPPGGIGIAPVPHDRDAFADVASFPNPAFLQTTRAAAEVDLLRRYPDQANGATNNPQGTGSSLTRPFIDREVVFPITPTAGGSDSRGIVIDPTPRIACKARVQPADPSKGRSQAEVDAEMVACARKPARVFIANRSPSSLILGEVGGDTGDGGAYDPDRLTMHSSIPLTAGPSNVYLAPIVDKDGAYALRVFIVCFDSATIFVYDPDQQQLETTIRVGPGPFAMAFDPFKIEDVATNQKVKLDPVEAGVGRALRRYRFAYLASFTQSYVQLIDLDNARVDRSTFERVVYTLGFPTNPKGT
jgi:hypothetical protein